MVSVLLRRVGVALTTLVIASILIWMLLMLTPGDPATGVLHAQGNLEPTPAQVRAMRSELGLDDPLVHRYLNWLKAVLHGDFGLSWKSGRPVTQEFARRLPATLRLTTAALVLAVVGSLVMGMASAAKPSKLPDRVIRIGTLTMVIVPGFLLGLFILNVLVLRFDLGVIVTDGSWVHVGWPAVTLACGSAGYWTRVLRAAILEARSAPYLDVCRARGASMTRQILVHALPNSIAPYVTIVGLGAAGLLGGATIVESVFTWPGIGSYAVEAITARDAPVILGFTMFAVTTYVAASLLIDVALMLVDPRLRRRHSVATA